MTENIQIIQTITEFYVLFTFLWSSFLYFIWKSDTILNLVLKLIFLLTVAVSFFLSYRFFFVG